MNTTTTYSATQDEAYHASVLLAGRILAALPAAALALLIELGGGILLLIGWKTRQTAWVLALFTLIAVFNQSAHFSKNVSIIGGLLVLAATGPGQYSVDQT